MILGIMIISTGFSLPSEEQIITENDDGTTTVTQTTINYAWLDTTLGIVMLLFGLAGFVGVNDYRKKRNNPYYQGD